MKTTLGTIGLCVGLLVALTPEAPAKTTSEAAHYLPTLFTDFSDLDVRDAENRSISTPEAFGELLVLFRQTLVQTLMVGGNHSLGLAMADLDSLLRLFNDRFISRSTEQNRCPEAANVNAKRRVVHNVDKLWITCLDGDSRLIPSSPHSSLLRIPQKLYLRC